MLPNTFSRPMIHAPPPVKMVVLHEGLALRRRGRIMFFRATWTAAGPPAGQPTRKCHMAITFAIHCSSTMYVVNIRWGTHTQHDFCLPITHIFTFLQLSLFFWRISNLNFVARQTINVKQACQSLDLSMLKWCAWGCSKIGIYRVSRVVCVCFAAFLISKTQNKKV